MLYCSNYSCQAPNPDDSKFCQTCRTPLIRRHLWAVGEGVEKYQLGQLLAGRYLYEGDRVFLDTMPGLPPTPPDEVSQAILPYLRLAPYQLHIPQVYGVIDVEGGAAAEIIVLEHAPIVETMSASAAPQAQAVPTSVAEMSPKLATAMSNVRLWPTLTDSWAAAPAIRQLSWLWQLTQLWQPLSAELVASSVFIPELLRVEGPILRFLELRFDARQAAPTLEQLGQMWQRWATTAHPHLAPFLNALCQQMIQGQIQSANQILAQLDQALSRIGRSQSYAIQVVSATDQGPSRQRNEDACYPPSGTKQNYVIRDGQPLPPEASYLIVCDGIGGHQGGDVASQIAIEAVKQHLHQVPLDQVTPKQLLLELETSVCRANDFISENNDVQNRRERERMGTTLVMGLMLGAEVYIAHIGDSRAYWITQHGCHQITLDDDIASRELRLGYNTYRNALQHPSSGSLVQALGMGSSATLHPTVQRFLVDEDSIFLLCSDGLSDNDRVEEYWETVLLPVLNGQSSLSDATQQLIDIANTQNGYDNVTIGLLHYRVVQQRSQPLPLPDAASQPLPKTRVQVGQPTQLQSNRSSNDVTAPLPSTQPTSKSLDLLGLGQTQVLEPAPTATPRIGLLLLGIVVLLGLSGLLIHLLVPSVGDRLIRVFVPSNPSPTESTDLSSSPSAMPAPPTSLQVGSLIRIIRSTVDSPNASTDILELRPRPEDMSFPASPNEQEFSSPDGVDSSDNGNTSSGATPTPSASIQQTGPEIQTGRVIPAGSVLQVLGKQEGQGQSRWIRLKVCVIPGDGAATVNSAAQLLQEGDVGWIQEERIVPIVSLTDLSPTESGACS